MKMIKSKPRVWALRMMGKATKYLKIGLSGKTVDQLKGINMEEEYELIKAKKSKLPSQLRGLILHLHDAEGRTEKSKVEVV